MTKRRKERSNYIGMKDTQNRIRHDMHHSL